VWPPHDTQLVPDDWERNLRGERVERRLAAILAGDVAGYSRLLGLDEEGTLAALKGHRRAVVDPKIAEHRGRIVKTTGDGILVEFASIVDALRCAVDIQRQMAERNAEIPPKRRIEFRIGLNVGDIIIDDKDIFGDGVNIATHRLGEAARKAVAADDTDAMAHTALAIFEHSYKWLIGSGFSKACEKQGCPKSERDSSSPWPLRSLEKFDVAGRRFTECSIRALMAPASSWLVFPIWQNHYPCSSHPD